MNAVYNEYFAQGATAGPTRTCVAVKQLPHPNLLVEMKCCALDPQ
jgi:2-aminomuconate deaminase